MNKCKCGDCNELTNSDYAPGHDQKLRSALEQRVGGLLNLKQLIAACEDYSTGKITESEVLCAIKKLLYRRSYNDEISSRGSS